MSEERTIEELIRDVWSNFSTESDKQDKTQKILTRADVEDVMRNYLQSSTQAYRAGERLSLDEWQGSAAASEARTDYEREILDARRDYYDARARAIRSKNGQGSGYGAYAASERKASYERALEDAAAALAESYGEFYDELEGTSSGASFKDRLSVISYIAANNMSEHDGLLYALAAGLSYEEASELANGASILASLLDERFEGYKKALRNDE